MLTTLCPLSLILAQGYLPFPIPLSLLSFSCPFGKMRVLFPFLDMTVCGLILILVVYHTHFRFIEASVLHKTNPTAAMLNKNRNPISFIHSRIKR